MGLFLVLHLKYFGRGNAASGRGVTSAIWGSDLPARWLQPDPLIIGAGFTIAALSHSADVREVFEIYNRERNKKRPPLNWLISSSRAVGSSRMRLIITHRADPPH
jgi:hypothetical protein